MYHNIFYNYIHYLLTYKIIVVLFAYLFFLIIGSIILLKEDTKNYYMDQSTLKKIQYSLDFGILSKSKSREIIVIASFVIIINVFLTIVALFQKDVIFAANTTLIALTGLLYIPIYLIILSNYRHKAQKYLWNIQKYLDKYSHSIGRSPAGNNEEKYSNQKVID